MLGKYTLCFSFVFFTIIAAGYARECTKMNVLGYKIGISCPRPFIDPDTAVFCCTNDNGDLHCCEEFYKDVVAKSESKENVPNALAFSDDSFEDFRDSNRRLGTVVAAVSTIGGLLVLACCICCFCCPCCLIYKRRQRGVVYRSAAQQPNVVVAVQPNYVPQQQPPYPTSGPMMAPMQPYPPPAGFNTDQPPPYPGNDTEHKQSAYNPYYK